MKDKNKTKILSNIETCSATGETVRLSKERSQLTSLDRPTPLNFDAFLPWICLEWQLPEVIVVTRQVQEDYVKKDRKSSLKPNKSLKFKHEDLESTTESTMKSKKSTITTPTEATDFLTSTVVDNALVIKAFYDTKGHLVEISIVGCPFIINRRVIKAFSICVPFHSLLTKLTIRRGGVTNGLLQEIGRMLPHSNLTDICLDDCAIAEGQYCLVIEEPSQLKCLSLNRCRINDAACTDIAKKLDIESSGSTLLVLELGSNLISDVGAKALGDSLRRNRRLLHLNVSGNMITDEGAASLLSQLKEFKLTWDEIVQARQRKLKYTEKKVEVYANCYEEVLKRQKSELLVASTLIKPSKSESIKIQKEDRKKQKKSPPPSVFVEEKSAVEIAGDMTIDIIGEFSDPYDVVSIVKKDGKIHSKGNMVICSLNLAYNNLNFLSIRRIHDVLKYQSTMVKVGGATGLLRVVFDGNYIPDHCIEYDRIEMFLKKAVNDSAPVAASNIFSKKRTVSAPASKRL